MVGAKGIEPWCCFNCARHAHVFIRKSTFQQDLKRCRSGETVLHRTNIFPLFLSLSSPVTYQLLQNCIQLINWVSRNNRLELGGCILDGIIRISPFQRDYSLQFSCAGVRGKMDFDLRGSRRLLLFMAGNTLEKRCCKTIRDLLNLCFVIFLAKLTRHVQTTHFYLLVGDASGQITVDPSRLVKRVPDHLGRRF